MDKYKVEQLKTMLAHEAHAEHGGYGARLTHWWGDTKTLTIDAGGLRALIDYYSQEPNAPLTMDELRGMEGEPVWVICDEAATKDTPGFEPLAFWTLVEVCEESIFLTNNLGGRTEYAADVEFEDDGIIIYRRKPEEGTI